jgi:hypothetical protein
MGHISLSEAQALSPDGHCKTFDASADGKNQEQGSREPDEGLDEASYGTRKRQELRVRPRQGPR